MSGADFSSDRLMQSVEEDLGGNVKITIIVYGTADREILCDHVRVTYPEPGIVEVFACNRDNSVTMGIRKPLVGTVVRVDAA